MPFEERDEHQYCLPPCVFAPSMNSLYRLPPLGSSVFPLRVASVSGSRSQSAWRFNLCRSPKLGCENRCAFSSAEFLFCSVWCSLRVQLVIGDLLDYLFCETTTTDDIFTGLDALLNTTFSANEEIKCAMPFLFLFCYFCISLLLKTRLPQSVPTVG